MAVSFPAEGQAPPWRDQLKTYVDQADVASGAVNGSGHLIVTLKDGSTIDMGIVGGGGGGAVASVNGETGTVVLDAADVGAVPTSRTVAGKPLSANVTLVKGDVGLGSVDNTSDASKPVSTAQQTALNSKADLVGGVVPTSQMPPLAINETFTVASQVAMLALTAQRGDMAIRTDNGRTYVLSSDSPATLADWKEVQAAGQVTSVASKTGVVSLVKADVGLSNVDNTSDANKPVSTAQQAAIDALDKADVGLSNVDNTSDANKPVSTAQAAEIDLRPAIVEVVTGNEPRTDAPIVWWKDVQGRTPSTQPVNMTTADVWLSVGG